MLQDSPPYTTSVTPGSDTPWSTANGTQTIEPIAIVGLAAKFPQDATSPKSFWNLMQEGRSSMSEIPPDRWNIDAFYHPDKERLDCTNARGGHFLRGDVAAFDAPFFSIPKHEAEALDPQQRGLLECTYHALENAGISIASASGSKTGVFIGCMGREYDWTLARDLDSQHQYQAIGSGSAMLSNRLSWFYNFRGPSWTIDTACSSSMVALHQACQSLHSEESSTAIVGGCNLILNPDNMVSLSNLSFLSPDSLCYSFDHRANGYSRGEGFGVIVLKTLSRAIEDGDTVRALIRSTNCNQDGKTPGITNPSLDAQIALIRGAYDIASLDIDETRFFEAHGTGTQVGDTTEAAAINAVFGTAMNPEEPMVVGAVKSNIGHLEGASGIASIIKTVMILETGIIPPNTNYEELNPGISRSWPLKFPLIPMQWPSQGVRRASINSFGYGGTNAHAILEDAQHYMQEHGLRYRHNTRSPTYDSPTAAPNGSLQSTRLSREIEVALNSNRHAEEGCNGDLASKPFIVPLSAADEDGLQRQARALQAYLASSSNAGRNCLEDLTYTLSCKRSKLPWKSFCLIDAATVMNIQDLWGQCTPPARSSEATEARAVFVFTGQGAAWWDMGRELLQEPVYKDSLLASNQYLRELGCEWDLFEELTRGETKSKVLEPDISQPTTTALQIALVTLLRSWNVVPFSVVGHSSGEIAAAYCAGGLSHSAAIRAAFFRGKLASGLYRLWDGPPETMMVVALSLSEAESRVETFLGQGSICVACVNSPKHITLAGDAAALETMREMLEAEGIFAKKLRMDVAYHSPTMKRIASDYLKQLESLGRSEQAKDLPCMFSSVTGKLISVDELWQPNYWVENMVSRVCFSDALNAMREYMRFGPNDCVVEVGPTNALRRPILETLGDIRYSPCLGCEVSAWTTMFRLAGTLWCSNIPIDMLTVHGIDKSRARMLTDLPQYVFNHSRSYWHESRINQKLRMRRQPRNDLLGTPVTDSNSLEAKWRNTFRLREMPWIGDHRVNGSILYPAAGMVVMAIEAARQLVEQKQQRASGFRITNFRITNALIISAETESLEIEAYLHAAQNGCSWTFRICTPGTGGWTESCRGTVSVECQAEEPYVYWNGRASPEIVTNMHEEIPTRCVHHVETKQLYDNLHKFGFQYGPTFRALEEVRFNDENEASATICVKGWNARSNRHPHLIHPVILDALFQIPLAAVSRGGWQPIPILVPDGVGDIWISTKLLSSPPRDGMLRLTTAASQTGFREWTFQVTAFDSASQEPIVRMERYHGTAISSCDIGPLGNTEWRRICYNSLWKLDISTASPAQLARHCNDKAAPLAPASDAEKAVDEAELVCLFFMREALSTISNPDELSVQTYLHRYVAWMERQLQQPEALQRLASPEMLKLLTDHDYRNDLLSRVESSGPEGKVYTTIGQRLPSILRGETDVIELLFGDGLLQEFYAGASFAKNYEQMRAWTDLMAHKNPNMSILEIGAGTGGATLPILEALGHDLKDPHATPRFHLYDYTDISPGFFEAAKARFQAYADRVNFRVLDIEKDPEIQGFKPHSYDLVIASCVLHATFNVSQTLTNTRSLLKPSGKLLLFEPCEPDCARLSFVFGLLEGWWRAEEEHRQWSPLLRDADWHEQMKRSGFSGADLCLRDHESRAHTFSVLVSTAIELEQTNASTRSDAEVVLFVCSNSQIQTAIAEGVRIHLERLGYARCKTVDFATIGSNEYSDAICICLAEIDRLVLHQISTTEFTNIKQAIRNLKHLLWVTGNPKNGPLAGVVVGFARSINSEVDTLNLSTLSLEDTSSPVNAAAHIASIVQLPDDAREHEYVERNGELQIHRIGENNRLNNRIFRSTVPQHPEILPFDITDTSRALTLTTAFPGLLSSLHFVEELVSIDALERDEVEINVKAVGITDYNTMTALGQMPGRSLAQQCAGIVTRIGKAVPQAQFRPGDQVCCIASNAFTTRLRSHVSLVQKIPDSLDLETAASFPLSFCTAYHALFNLARLATRESVLVTDASSGVGRAVIQLAKRSDARIFAIVSTQANAASLASTCGIEPEHIFVGSSHSGGPLHTDIMRITNGHGVDVILDLPGNGGPTNCLECLEPFGRFVQVGPRKENEASSVNVPENASLFRVDVVAMIEKAKVLVGNVFANAVTRFAALHDQKPAFFLPNVFPVATFEDAFRHVQNDRSIQSAVIKLDTEGVAPIVRCPTSSYRFDGSATYIIAGGTGGLGRSIARWMLSRGARYIALLGRSGTQNRSVADLILQAEQNEAKIVAPACDIVDAKSLVRVIDDLCAYMPPVKGCIQGSMVLRDGLFENLTYEKFHAVLRPKIQGTLNLYNALPTSMDFFVMLSSTTGIFGSRGQSNYAAGSTFQDAFASHISSLPPDKRPTRVVSLDLGLMLGVGYAAERQHITDSLRSAGYEGICESEFQALLEWACDPDIPTESGDEQVITGISTPASIASKGLDEIFWMRKPIFSSLHQMDRRFSTATGAGPASAARDYRAMIQQASCVEAASQVIAEALVEKLSKALSMPAADFEVKKPVHTYGVDSLVAVEIRYWSQKEFDAEIAIFEIVQSASITQLCTVIAARSALVGKDD